MEKEKREVRKSQTATKNIFFTFTFFTEKFIFC